MPDTGSTKKSIPDRDEADFGFRIAECGLKEDLRIGGFEGLSAAVGWIWTHHLHCCLSGFEIVGADIEFFERERLTTFGADVGGVPDQIVFARGALRAMNDLQLTARLA